MYSATLNCHYSPGGLMNWMLDSDGNRTDYLYDSIGRLTGIWAANYDYVSFNYDAGGRLLEKMTSAGTDTRYSYNPDNSLAGLTNKHGLNTISNHAYSYDPLGNRSGQTETVGATTTNYTYGYDNLNRLTQVQNGSPAQQENYRYDPIGNRTSKSIGATLPSITAYVYDASNQLKEIRSGSATGTLLASLTYDADGNLKSRSDSGLTLGYDPLNRLTQATLGGQTQSYSYDDQGRRISKTVGTATTNFLYNDADIVAEYPATWGLPAAQYTHGNKIDDINIRATATAAQYFHQDGLGSVVGVTNQAGLTDATQRFDAWGNKLAATGAAPRYGYTGREPDETGLTYYRARYYDPSLGRFTQRDPIGLRGGLNRYAYVANDPCNATDPSGEFGLVGAVIGATINISMQMFKDGKSIGEINIGQVVVSAAVGAFTPGVFVMGGLLIGTESAIENWGWISLKDALIWQVTGEGSGAIAKQILEQKPWTFNGDSSNSNTAPSSTSVHGGGATVGGLPGRIAVPAAPYAGNQK